MKTVIILLLCIAAILLGYILFITVCAFLVDPKKEYDKSSRFYRRVMQSAAAIGLFVCGAKVRVSGMEKLPKQGRFLLVQNHRSNFDPYVTWYFLWEHNLAFISKESNFRIFIIGRLIRKCCFMAIDREDPRKALLTVHKAADLMRRDEVSVAVYPEGTRNKSYKGLLPFHNGMFKIAAEAGVPIVVTVVKGTERIHKNVPFRRTEVQFEIIEVISAEEVAAARRADLSARIRQSMLNSLGESE